MSLPTFLGIGAQKCGTTWLSRNLSRHPEIWMPPRKEIHYFDWRLGEPDGIVRLYKQRLFEDAYVARLWRQQVRSRPKGWWRHKSLSRIVWDLNHLFVPPSDRWYSSLFSGGRGMVRGEVTPGYATLSKKRVARVQALVPDAKLVFFMRNPIERAYSAAIMREDQTRKGRLTIAPHAGFSAHFKSPISRANTRYSRTLDTWGGFYAPDRVFVGFLEDVHLRPGSLLRRLCGFLGADPEKCPTSSLKKVHGRSGETMPAWAAVELAKAYRGEIERLDKRFGGYASFWRFCAERLIEEPPKEDVPYPLWDSPMWEEWAANQKPRPDLPEAAPQSGALSSLST